MNLRNRLFGECAKLVGSNDEIEVYINELINRLILFDKYFLKSIRLKEFNRFIQIFGFDATIELIKSGIIEFCCYAVSPGSIGQHEKIRYNRGLKPLPLFSYSFDIVRAADWKKYIELVTNDLNNWLSLSQNEKIKLQNIINEYIKQPPKEFGLDSISQLEYEILNNKLLVKRAILEILNEQVSVSRLDDLEFDIEIRKIGEKDFAVETDLEKFFGYDKMIAHKIVERSLLAIGGLNLRIEEMKIYNALSGFQDRDLPILEKKLEFLVDAICPHRAENDFKRVLEIKDFPEIEYSQKNVKIDVNKLMKIRESREIKEFRVWLSEIDSLSDQDIFKIIKGIKSKISDLYSSKTSKILRFLLGTALGPAGIAMSAIDNFIVSKVLKKSGPYVFINHLYPSIFKKD